MGASTICTDAEKRASQKPHSPVARARPVVLGVGVPDGGVTHDGRFATARREEAFPNATHSIYPHASKTLGGERKAATCDGLLSEVPNSFTSCTETLK